jgi:hypothetical protein
MLLSKLPDTTALLGNGQNSVIQGWMMEELLRIELPNMESVLRIGLYFHPALSLTLTDTGLVWWKTVDVK